MRLWHPTSLVGARARMRCGGAIADPEAAGDRVKTDRRDGTSLAKLHRCWLAGLRFEQAMHHLED